MQPKQLPPGLNRNDVKRLQASFNLIKPAGQVFTILFYKRLFEVAPETRALFNTDIETQARKLETTLEQAIAAVDQWEALLPALQALGRRHGYYGVKAEHYPIVASALVWSIESLLQQKFGPKDKAAWSKLLQAIATVMINATGTEQVELDTQRFFRRPTDH